MHRVGTTLDNTVEHRREGVSSGFDEFLDSCLCLPTLGAPFEHRLILLYACLRTSNHPREGIADVDDGLFDLASCFFELLIQHW